MTESRPKSGCGNSDCAADPDPLTVRVRLYNHLRRYAPGSTGDFSISLDAGSDIRALLARLGISADIPRVILVNGRRKDEQALLAEGDTVVMFDPVSGG